MASRLHYACMLPFTVTIGSVHGPLEAVLEMVEKRKLFVNDIALAQITDEYVAFVQNNALPLEERANFVAVASVLLLLKARSLLPTFTFTRDEELQVSGLRRDLERYAYFRKIARALEKAWGERYVPEQKRDGRRVLRNRDNRQQTRSRGSLTDNGFEQEPVYFFAPGQDVTKDHLLFAMHSMLHTLPAFKQELKQTTVKSIKSIEQVVVELVERVSRAMKTSFRDSIKGAPREEVIVYFLGMLELVKRGVIDAEQDERDGIMLKKVGGGVMHVG